MSKLQFRVLYRQFLLRIIDLDLIAPQGDVSKLLGQFAALLAIVSLWVMTPAVGLAMGLPEEPELGLVMAWVGEHFLISSTMLVVGLFAVLSWESMFPDRRDVLVLSPLPVRGRTLFAAKAAAVATALSLTVLTLDFFPGLFAPFVFSSAPAAPPPQYDAAMAPVSAANLKTVLDRDLVPAMTGDGALTPAKHAGVAVGVLEHGDQRILAYGTAKQNSILEIGSITKTFTGLALAQMVEEGKLRLDQPLRELLPPGTVAKPQGDEITLLDLATHRSGLPQTPDNQRPNYDYSVANLYAYIAKHGVAKPASTEFRYSNLGFGLLGQALANRAGMTYPFLVQEEVTGPLGLTDTVVSLSAEKDLRLIPGYDTSNHPMLHWDHAGLAGAGSLHSTAGDMLTYLDAQLHPERFGTLARALEESHRPRASADAGNGIGLAWAYNPVLGVYWHNGATAGYSSFAFFYPKGDVAGVVLLNTTPRIISFADQLGAHIGQRLAGLPRDFPREPGNSGERGTDRQSAVARRILDFDAGSGNLPLLLDAEPARPGTATAATSFPADLCGVADDAVLPDPDGIFCATRFCIARIADCESDAAGLAALVLVLRLVPGSERNAAPSAARHACAKGVDRLKRVHRGRGRVLSDLLFPDTAQDRRTTRHPTGPRGPALAAWFWKRFHDGHRTVQYPYAGAQPPASRDSLVLPGTRLRAGDLLCESAGAARGRFRGSVASGQRGDDCREHRDDGLRGAGARVVFSLPLDLRANWIFRVTPIPGVPESMTASRRALYVLAVIPVWAIAAVVFLWLWPWRAAAGHLTVLALLSAIVAELCLHNFRKLTFTCSYLPGRSYAHMAVLSLIGLAPIGSSGWPGPAEQTNISRRRGEPCWCWQ